MSTPVTFSWTVPATNPANTPTVPFGGGGERDPYGVDLWFDLAAANGPDLVVTGAGDWMLARGRECLRQSLLRRFLTNPGEWATKPDYGAGAKLFVKARNTRAARDELSGRLRAQALKDKRVASVESVAVVVAEGVVKIAVTVIPRAETKRARPLVAAVEVR